MELGCLGCVIERRKGEEEEVTAVRVVAATLRVGFGVGSFNLFKKILSSIALSIFPPSALSWLL